jgi:hypothetical protein
MIENLQFKELGFLITFGDIIELLCYNVIGLE